MILASILFRCSDSRGIILPPIKRGVSLDRCLRYETVGPQKEQHEGHDGKRNRSEYLNRSIPSYTLTLNLSGTRSEMPTGPIDSKGNELFFVDSGPITGSVSYTTIVVYHGAAFTGHTFHKLLPLAAHKNLRLVLLNRREYPGSAKYTAEELEDLTGGRKVFLERLGLEVPYFLSWFAEKYNIPKASANRKSGGFVVMAWSLGAVTPLSLLGNPDVIPTKTYAKLKLFLRQVIIYDPSYLAFGYDPPGGCYAPFTDPELKSTAEVFSRFYSWASAFYANDLTSRSAAGLDCSKCGLRPSIDRMSSEEMKLNIDSTAAVRTELPILMSMQPALKDQAKRALFDEALARTFLPDLPIVFVTCHASCWYCTWAFIETERVFKGHIAKGRYVRPIRFVELKDAHHFVHWDEPEAFLTVVAEAIHN